MRVVRGAHTAGRLRTSSLCASIKVECVELFYLLVGASVVFGIQKLLLMDGEHSTGLENALPVVTQTPSFQVQYSGR